jgi:hypothetical protein
MLPTLPPLLQRFISDEIQRAPDLIERVAFLTLRELREPRQKLPTVGETRLYGDLAFALSQHRDAFGKAFVEALRQQVELDLSRHHQGYVPTGRGGEPSRLTLLDDVELAADVELGRVIEQIHDVAEWEQRELQTFTSTIAGRDHVTPESNPLRAEVMARALWHAVDALPMPRGQQVLLMHAAGEALAQVLKLAYAAASTRLEGQGVEPSRYRTGVPPTATASALAAGDAVSAPAARSLPPSAAPATSLDLQLETMPMPFADLVPPPASRPDSAPDTGAELQAARAAFERQVAGIVSRRFGEIDATPSVHPELRVALRKVRDIVQRQALRDSSVLDDDAHPGWQLLRRALHQAYCRPDPRDPRSAAYAAYASGLLDGTLGHGTPTDEALHRVVAKLDGFAQRQFVEQVADAGPDIDALLAAESAAPARQPQTPGPAVGVAAGERSPRLGVVELALDSRPSGLDEGPLAAESPQARSAADWLSSQQPGRWYRLLRDGRWMRLQLLWRSPGQRHWLFASEQVGRRESLSKDRLLRLRVDGAFRLLGER